MDNKMYIASYLITTFNAHIHGLIVREATTPAEAFGQMRKGLRVQFPKANKIHIANIVAVEDLVNDQVTPYEFE